MKKLLLATPALMALMSGCTGSSSAPASTTAPVAEQTPWEKPVPKAACGSGDAAEPALQGQVTLLERLGGFTGTRCNLELVGQWSGQGASVAHAAFGHCDYYSQAGAVGVAPAVVPGRVGLLNPGVVVIDASDPAHPVVTDHLNSISLVDPWESLKINQKRGLLAAVNGLGGGGGPQFDVYDLNQDCAHPKLLASVALGNASLKGHEGNWAPDGETYYAGDVNDNLYYAIDVKDPAAPKLIAQWTPTEVVPPNPAAHGLSVSVDGNRGYFVHAGGQQIPALLPGSAPQNGFDIVDTSEIQARKPNPQVKVLATVLWKDGASAQHTIPISIKGHPYLVHVDELGIGGIGTVENWAGACAEGMPPFGFARIFDIATETQPRLAAKIMLEVHDPANCADVVLDNTGQLLFGYDSHQCSVDDQSEASILMCGQFASGLRVYDIRDPYHPREIAYYNPPARPGYQAGSGYNLTGLCGTTDWSASIPVFRKDSGQIWFTSTCNGFQALKFTNGVWPLKN
jgi:hypothetical protein